MTEVLQRKMFRIALVGEPALVHGELLRRAGYQVVGAKESANASQLFRRGNVIDAVIVDFSLGGHPPEAVLLFARRANPGAPVLALVGQGDDGGYRRAFLAGARDVLPSPARGEDVLDAIDLALEPRALAALVDELQAQIPLAGTDYRPDAEDALFAELTELREQLQGERERRTEVTQKLRTQALDAVQSRDATFDDAARLQRELDDERRLRHELEMQIRHMRVSENALRENLSKARARRSSAEKEASATSLRLQEIEATHKKDWSTEVDPELAMRERSLDEERLASLDQALRKKAELDEEVTSLRRTAFADSDTNHPPIGADADETAIITKPAIEAARVELQRTIQQRDILEERVLGLEAELFERSGQQRALLDLRSEIDKRDDRISALQRQRDNAEDMLARLSGVEAELLESQRALLALRTEVAELERVRDHQRKRINALDLEVADNALRLDELLPLREEVDRLCAKLRAERLAHVNLRKRVLATSEGLVSEQDPLATAQDENGKLQAEVERLRGEVFLAKQQLARTRQS